MDATCPTPTGFKSASHHLGQEPTMAGTSRRDSVVGPPFAKALASLRQEDPGEGVLGPTDRQLCPSQLCH